MAAATSCSCAANAIARPVFFEGTLFQSVLFFAAGSWRSLNIKFSEARRA